MTAASLEAAVPVRDRVADRRLVRAWLFAVAALLVGMIVLGGATRLTQSGLSITEWKPIHGVIPPLSDTEWQEEFAKYQQIPEYQVLNRGMSLDGFKTLFWWEWSHRLLGRLIGFAVALPLVFFWVTGRIERRLVPRIVALLVLGGLQGALGWWMVASGLAVRTDVSQYRLAAHLVLGCICLAYTLWLAGSLALRPAGWRAPAGAVKATAVAVLGLAFLQIYLGGLVAGLDAGLTYNTWPLMDGRLVPTGLFGDGPLWLNFFENVTTVQFSHRIGAYLLLAAVVVHLWVAARSVPRETSFGRAASLLGLVMLQAALGISTLLHVVPLSLALLHQLGAVLVLSAAALHVRAMSPAMAGEAARA